MNGLSRFSGIFYSILCLILFFLMATDILASDDIKHHNDQTGKTPHEAEPVTGIEGDDLTIDLFDVFDHVDGNIDGFTILVNSKPHVASVSIDENILLISFLQYGQTNIVIQAAISDEHYEVSFVIGVKPLIEGNYILSDFSNLSLPPEYFWNGSDQSGGFTSALAHFPNYHNPDWGYWNGWAYSNVSDNTTPGWLNQYSAITGEGIPGDESLIPIYAITYVDQESVIHFVDSSAHEVKGAFITNSTFAALSMKYGDAIAKKFGGPDGNDPDWFKLNIWGVKDGEPTETVAFYLADYRFENNTENYIIQTWQWVELSALGKVDSLMFSLSSSDVGDWGINTPAYFALDHLYVKPDAPPFVANPIDDIFLPINADDYIVDLGPVFSDPDDDDEAIVISLQDHSNPYLLNVGIDAQTMTLSISGPNTGVAHITLEALSNGKTVSESFKVTVFDDPDVHYIAEVIEYKPAPGQFINKEPWGLPSSAQSIIGGINGHLSLGAYGGYVVFRFEEPVVNHPANPYGVDFVIFGNPTPYWSEPGIVWVMKDENGNGLPDGTWYQLAGSDHFFSETLYDYAVTYVNPQSDVAADVPWYDNYGNAGHIFAHGGHQQPYYPKQDHFPDIDPVEYTLTGTRIVDAVDMSEPGMVKSKRRAFGYADNQIRGTAPFNRPDNPYKDDVQHAGGDGFDIGWAIDANGQYIDLDEIHFIKVQTAVLANAGWMGEVSTEITGAVAVQPNSTITGSLDLIVIKDLPKEITEPQYQLEAFAFHRGRVRPNAEIHWSVDLEGAVIDDEMVLHLTQSGPLNLTAWLADDPDIVAYAESYVNLDDDTTPVVQSEVELVIYPNPVSDAFIIKAEEKMEVRIYDLSGRMRMENVNYKSGEHIYVKELPDGIYILQIRAENKTSFHRLLKK